MKKEQTLVALGRSSDHGSLDTTSVSIDAPAQTKRVKALNPLVSTIQVASGEPQR